MRPLLALLLVACTNPFIPEGTARIDPPPEYRVWWEASRACIDRPEFRAFEDIEWYWSPDLLKGSDGEDALGLTIENRVYLYVDVAQTPWIVQHELVHAINRLGAHPHPYDPFVTCGLMPTTSAPCYISAQTRYRREYDGGLCSAQSRQPKGGKPSDWVCGP